MTLILISHMAHQIANIRQKSQEKNLLLILTAIQILLKLTELFQLLVTLTLKQKFYSRKALKVN